MNSYPIVGRSNRPRKSIWIDRHRLIVSFTCGPLLPLEDSNASFGSRLRFTGSNRLPPQRMVDCVTRLVTGGVLSGGSNGAVMIGLNGLLHSRFELPVSANGSSYSQLWTALLGFSPGSHSWSTCPLVEAVLRGSASTRISRQEYLDIVAGAFFLM